MRILLVSYEFPPSGGGEASYTRTLAAGLASLGHEATVLVPKAANARLDDGKFRIVTTGSAGPVRGASFLAGAELAIGKLAREERPDVVHVTFDYPTSLLHLENFGLPAVATIHHLHVVQALAMCRLEPSAWKRASMRAKASVLTSLEARLVRRCDLAIAVSRFTAATAERQLGVERERLRVVVNGIDGRPFHRGDASIFRKEFPEVREEAVLYVGRLSEAKGLDVLVEAFSKLGRREGATLVLVGAGEPSYVRRLSGRVASLGISKSVVFTGRISDEMLPHAYAAANVTVLPSYMEGFGLSILESMASGRTPIATRVGGVPEVIADGRTGVLVPPGDAGRLAQSLDSILGDPSARELMGRNASREAGTTFTSERMVSATLAAYDEAIVRKGVRQGGRGHSNSSR